jgi:hypothetical protein
MAHVVRHLCASDAGDGWTSMDACDPMDRLRRSGTCASHLGTGDRRAKRVLSGGEGFEPSIRLTTDHGFRDRRSCCESRCYMSLRTASPNLNVARFELLAGSE